MNPRALSVDHHPGAEDHLCVPRVFSFGHARQLESVLREHLIALAGRTELLAGIESQAFIDIDSLLRPVYGHAKQGASYGHTKIAGKQILRKGLSPLATTISTPKCAPVIAGMRLRAGKSGSGKGGGRMIAQAIATARAVGASGNILVRGDSAYARPRGRTRVPAREGSVLAGHGQAQGNPARHRLHRGVRMDPGALPERRPGPRHRCLDL